MGETATVRVLFLGDSAGAIRSTNLLSRSFGGLARSAKFAGVAITAGIVTGLVSATKAAIDFDRSMRNVNSIAKLSDQELERVSKRVLGLAKVSGQAPKVLADGLYDIVSSGFDANAALKILDASARAASAGQTTTAVAAKAISAALNAYHLPARKAREVSDVLFETVNRGVLTFEELAQNMGDLVPAAAPLGIPLEEVGAAMATITLQGVPAAEAATRVKNSFLQLATPSKGMKELLHDAGYESGEAAVAALGYTGVLELLNDQTKGSVTETAKLTPEIRALMGQVGLTGRNLKTYKDNLKAMKEASEDGGAASEAFAEQGKSVGVQWDKAKARLTAAGISLATSWMPAVGDAIGHAERFAGWLERLAEQDTISAKVKFTVAGIGGLARGVGSELGSMLFGTEGKRVRVPIEGNRFELQIVGQRRGLLDQFADQVNRIFSGGEMVGSQGRRVRVPVEGGRFEWKIVGAKEGWLNTLERELEGGVDKIDFTRVGRALATAGGGLIQVAGVLAVALAKLLGTAIREINWTDVGIEIGRGFKTALGIALPEIEEELARTVEDKLGKRAADAMIATEMHILGPVWGTERGRAAAFGVLDKIFGGEDASAAVARIGIVSGAVNTLGSQMDRLPKKTELLFTDNVPAAITRVEDLHNALLRVQNMAPIIKTISIIEERRSALPGRTGSRAFGGPVRMQETYRVNERGEEFFTAPASGRVDPVGAGGQVEAVVHVRGGAGDRAIVEGLIERVVVRSTPKISKELGRLTAMRLRTLR